MQIPTFEVKPGRCYKLVLKDGQLLLERIHDDPNDKRKFKEISFLVSKEKIVVSHPNGQEVTVPFQDKEDCKSALIALNLGLTILSFYLIWEFG